MIQRTMERDNCPSEEVGLKWLVPFLTGMCHVFSRSQFPYLRRGMAERMCRVLVQSPFAIMLMYKRVAG